MLKKFVLLFDDHFSKVGKNVITESQIRSLKKEKISAIEFTVKEKSISLAELKSYLLIKYEGCKWVRKEWDLYLVVNETSGNIFCEIKYINIAIPTFIIKILPT